MRSPRVDLEALRALAAGVALDRAVEVVVGAPGCGWSIQTHTGRIQVDPDDLASLPLDELYGLTCHEAAHAAVTRYGWLLPRSVLFRPGMRSLLNALEDCRIEDWLFERHPGSRAWITQVNDRLMPRVGETLAERPPFVQFCLAAIHDWWHGELPDGLDPEVRDALATTASARRAAIAARPPIEPDTPHSARYAQSRVARVFQRHDGLSTVDGFEQAVRLSAAASWAVIWAGVVPVYERLVAQSPPELVARVEARFLQLTREVAPGLGLGRPERPGAVADEIPAIDARALDEALSPPPTDDWDSARRDVLPLVDDLVAALLRVLRPRTLPRWIPGWPSGQQLDLRAAMRHDARPQPERLWLRKTVPERTDPRFLLLLDLSGSMDGDRIRWGFRGTVLMAEVLQRLDLPFAVYGFQDALIPFKPFERPLDACRPALSTMPLEVTGSRPSGWNRPAHNWDGPVLAAAADVLLARPSRTPVLFVASDGLPSGPADPEGSLRRAIADVGARAHLVGVGLGPGTGHVARYYPHALAEVPLERFPAAIGQCIERVLGER